MLVSDKPIDQSWLLEKLIVDEDSFTALPHRIHHSLDRSDL